MCMSLYNVCVCVCARARVTPDLHVDEVLDDELGHAEELDEVRVRELVQV